MKFVARCHENGVCREHSACAVSRQEDFVFIQKVVVADMFAYPFQRFHRVENEHGISVFGSDRITDVDHRKPTLCDMIAVVFIQFLVRVHKPAAMEIDHYGEFARCVFRIVNVEQVFLFAVVDVGNVVDRNDAGRQRLFDHSLLVAAFYHFTPKNFV